jgi:predicted metal-dependent hydrolase
VLQTVCPPSIDRIIRSRRKTLSLLIDEQGKLIVRAPSTATDRDIHALVERKRPWIESKQRMARERYRELQGRGFGEGAAYPYLGTRYPLRHLPAEDGGAPFVFTGREFLILNDRIDDAGKLMTAWYREQAQRIIPERVNRYAALSGTSFERVRITGAMKRWGSCTSTGNLNFSWRLVMAPLEVIDYVVVHELSHRKEQNHSSRFWTEVERVMPEYRTYRAWLSRHGYGLRI